MSTRTPTQAQLDAAVMAAAEAWADAYATRGDGMSTRYQLYNTVRARRDAMRPHKAALLAMMQRGHTSLYFRDDDAMSLWNEMAEIGRSSIRTWVERILAAPDEPTEVG